MRSFSQSVLCEENIVPATPTPLVARAAELVRIALEVVVGQFGELCNRFDRSDEIGEHFGGIHYHYLPHPFWGVALQGRFVGL